MKRGTMELIQKSVENDQLKWVNDEMVGTKSFSMFENQVGGHTNIIKIGSEYIGKPIIPREVKYYLTKHKSLTPFLPKFEGIICLPQNAKIETTLDSVKSSQFVLLEDLTSSFVHPCVLDIKMGTRVHGDFASPEKIAEQSKKCLETTSNLLGARLCGSIWHNPNDSKSYKTNKYEDRKLDPQCFEKRLLHFFSDGKCIRKDVVSQVIRKLEELKRTVCLLESYRFFSCSLLFIYDGSKSFDHSETKVTSPDVTIPNVMVKIIDFAHATFHGFMDDPIKHKGPDLGFLKGINSILTILKAVIDRPKPDFLC